MDATVNPRAQAAVAQDDFLATWETAYRHNAQTVAPSALQQAHRVWFDTLACIAGGAGERSTQAARKSCAGTALGPVDEALVWGTAAHALDYDDVCMLATCHPSAPVVSALLALLPHLGETQAQPLLEDVLMAHLVGTETMLRLGQWMGFGHYALGFHSTSTLGGMGAAAACAHLLKLPVAQARTALSIAASAAAGLRANFGTDTKPLHVGFAASAGVRAVLLAQAGASASDDTLGKSGFVRAFSGAAVLPPLPWRESMAWAVESPGFEIKRFPSCYLTHRMIAGIQTLRARHAQPPGGAPVRIDVEFPLSGMAPLKYPQPSTGLEGKFSAPYCAAAAWLDDGIGLATFADAAVGRAAIQAQMLQVSVHERSALNEGLESAPVRVRITTERWDDALSVDWAPGSLQDPLPDADLLGKWADCVAHGGAALAQAPLLGRQLLHAAHSEAVAPLLAEFRQAILGRAVG